MAGQPILSICIPTYNRAKYLEKTLQSIVKEKIFAETNLVEIIVSNNCSNDNTYSICKKFQEKYPDKIKYIKQESAVPPDKHNFKTFEYASGQFCKLNNDTCMFKENSLEKIINLLTNNIGDAAFFLNKSDIEPKVVKCSSFGEFIKNASYEATWIGGFCIKKDIFCNLTLPSMYLDLKLPQTWIYGTLFANDYSVSIIQDNLFEVQHIPNKGADYNIAKVFGQNYFKILSDFLKEKNGITPKIIDKEKKSILPFIENFYFDFNNEFCFQKTGYLKYMLSIYYNRLYFWKSYLKAMKKIYLTKNLLKKIFSVNNLYLDNKKYKQIYILGLKFTCKNKNYINETFDNCINNETVKDNANNNYPKYCSVGKHTYEFNINNVEYFSTTGKEKLIIGDYCSIGPDVRFIVASEHQYKGLSTYPFKVKILGEDFEAQSKGDIIVKDDVWIGLNSIILSGLTIGQGAVVAAGSVVTKDVPPYAIVGGNPAKVIKYRFEPEIIEKLLQFDYSNLTEEKIQILGEKLYTEITKDNIDELLKEFQADV